jgi:hypothetical protein
MCTFWRAFWTMYSMKAVQLELRFTTVEKERTIVSLCCFCISQVRAIQFPQNLFKTEHRHVHCRTACSLLKLDDVSLSYARKGGRIWEKKWVLFHVFGVENKDGDVFGGQRTYHDIARIKTHLEIEALSRKRQGFRRGSGWRACGSGWMTKRSCGSERAAWASEDMVRNAFARSGCTCGRSMRRKLGSCKDGEGCERDACGRSRGGGEGAGGWESVEKDQDMRILVTATHRWIRHAWKYSAVRKKEGERSKAAIVRSTEWAGEAGSAAELHRWHRKRSAKCALAPTDTRRRASLHRHGRTGRRN